MENINYTLDDVLAFDSRFRTTFINSIGGFKTPVLIGTCDKQGHSNLAIFNSLIHIGAMPPLIGFIARPDSVERHTLQNILDTHIFTINHVREEFYKEAHQTSARYAKHESEFEKVGLTPEYQKDCMAPYVKESSIKISADFVERIDLSINGTVMIIGKIRTIHVPTDCVTIDGFVDIEKAGSIAVTGLDSYYSTRSIGRLSYAKPNQPLVPISSVYLE